MLYIKDFTKGKAVYDALNSEVRLKMLEMLINGEAFSLDEFAKKLGISNAAITAHAKKLENAKLIKVSLVSATRGIAKLCHLNTNRLIIDIVPPEKVNEKSFEAEISIGSYSNFSVTPTCGIVTTKHIIGGSFDEARFFSYPERRDAALLWFTTGYLEYIVPNGLKPGQKLNELQLLMEIASEAPGCTSHYPSDIHFYLNDTFVGIWTTPGENNDRRGIFNPDWWFPNLGQYGKQKLISINNNGSFIDGFKISDVTIKTLNINSDANIMLKIEVPKTARNCGGLSLFGKGFGDYNNGIIVKYLYIEDKD